MKFRLSILFAALILLSGCNLFPGYFLPWANGHSGLGDSSWQNIGVLANNGGVNSTQPYEEMDMAVADDGTTLVLGYIASDPRQAHVFSYVNETWQDIAGSSVSLTGDIDAVSVDFLQSSTIMIPVCAASSSNDNKVQINIFSNTQITIDRLNSKYLKFVGDNAGEIALVGLSNVNDVIQVFSEYYDETSGTQVNPYASGIRKFTAMQNKDNPNMYAMAFMGVGGLEYGFSGGWYSSISNNSFPYYGTNTLSFIMTGSANITTNYLAYVDGTTDFLHVYTIVSNTISGQQGYNLYDFPYFQIKGLDMAFDYHSRRLYIAIITPEGNIEVSRFNAWDGNLQQPVNVGGLITADAHLVDIEVVGDVAHTLYLAYINKVDDTVQILKVQDN